jgi:hypothetical protein
MWVACLVALLVAVCPPRAGAQPPSAAVPTANPGRPTVATPATLTPLGYLQLETGLLAATNFGEFSRRFAVNEVSKVTVHPRAQLIFALEPLVLARGANAPAGATAGGSALGAQAVVVDGAGERATVSVGFMQALSEGTAPDLDIGSARQSLIFLVSDDVAGIHIDANLMLNRQQDAGRHRAQHGQTLSLARSVRAVVIFAEVWHFTQPFLTAKTAGTLWGVSYSVRPNLVLDGGFNYGLTKTSTPWEFFAGFTYVIPRRLWGA